MNDIFKETLNFTKKNKSKLIELLKKLDLKIYKNVIFEKIFCNILNKIKNIKKLGNQTAYKIASDIAKYHNIQKTKIFIFNNNLFLINLMKILRINEFYKIKINDEIYKYTKLEDIIKGFNNVYDLTFNDKIININNTNYDEIENYLIDWFKKI
jgi:hypothetical protein